MLYEIEHGQTCLIYSLITNIMEIFHFSTGSVIDKIVEYITIQCRVDGFKQNNRKKNARKHNKANVQNGKMKLI